MLVVKIAVPYAEALLLTGGSTAYIYTQNSLYGKMSS